MNTMTVDEIMTDNPVTLDPGATLSLAGELMLANRIRHIPIVDTRGGVVGLVTQRDLLMAAHGGDDRPLSEFMRRNIHTVDSHEDMRSAALLMQKYKIGCLPVMEDKVLVGIITDTDYVSLAINLLEQIEEMEPGESEDFSALDDVSEFDSDDDY
ncbi:MAG: CBS domain-containing protein [Proteobacteria bacterium]|jgi:CBS domain-containing membrane protein|nr:CBS domain-containing protein [Pseudomonadota bacterium]MDA1300251.1 CBS domain-containing protein [Pseudomonadota bacterium]